MNRRWIVPALAVVLAVFTTALIVGYLNQQARRAAVTAPAEATAPVLVAKADIPSHTVVAADAVVVKQVPASAIHPRALRNAPEAIGKVTVAPIFADEQVLSNMIAGAGPESGLAFALAPGMRAVTIPSNEVSQVAGFVVPGDRVDVVGTVQIGNANISKIFLQNVQVIAVAQTADERPGQPAKVSTSVTVALSPKQVEQLTQIDSSGRIRLALRPAGVNTQVETRGEDTPAALGWAAPAPPRPVVVVAPAAGPRAVYAPAPARAPGVEVWRGSEKTTINP